MTRYWRLYLSFVRFSLSRAMEFRLDFFFRIVMDLIYYGVNLAFFRLVFLHTPMLGGWTEPQVMVFVSGFLVLDAIQMTLFSNNLWWFPTLINRGDLDYYLVRPISSLFFVSLRDFAVNSFINFVCSIGILIWAVSRFPGAFGPLKTLLYLGLIVVGTLLHYCVHVLMLVPVFWTHSARGFEIVFYSMGKLGERPDRIFHGWVRRLLLSVVPLGLMVSYPARLVVERFDPWVFVHLIAVTATFFGLTVWAWNTALKSYSSASS